MATKAINNSKQLKSKQQPQFTPANQNNNTKVKTNPHLSAQPLQMVWLVMMMFEVS